LKYEIKYKPSYALLVVSLDQGETITAESGALTYMDPPIEAHTRKREKSLLGSLGLTLFGGQSFWVNDYTATSGPGRVGLVAAPVGDIETLEIKPDHGFIIQKSAYIASTQGIDLDVKWEGFTKGLFGQGLFMLKATGLPLSRLQRLMQLQSHKVRRIKRNIAGRRRLSDANHGSRRSSHTNQKPKGICRVALDPA